MPAIDRVHNAIAVFTRKTIDEILETGGSDAWVLDNKKAAMYEYLVCTRSGVKPVTGPEPQGSAFLVARISSIQPALHDPGRWLIAISEFALCNVPHAWKGWRNPVKYTTLDELGIDPEGLTFDPAPTPTPNSNPPRRVFSDAEGGAAPLSIAQAKAGLAAAFGVALEDIQITIKG